MTQVKICGLSRQEDIDIINQNQPDYAGFIINIPTSHRSVSFDQLKVLTSRLDKGVKAVGVFRDEAPEIVAKLLNQEIIDYAQLHGDEDEAYLQQLKKLTNKPLIKAFSVESQEDLDQAQASSSDYILLDHGPGGSGQSFDWSLLQGFKSPYFLAGGLNQETIPQALKQLNPMAIDLASGTETNKLKDPVKIKEIINYVRKN